MKLPCSSLGMNTQCDISGLGRSKLKIMPTFPLTKICLIIVIEKAVAFEYKFKRDCLWRSVSNVNRI